MEKPIVLVVDSRCLLYSYSACRHLPVTTFNLLFTYLISIISKELFPWTWCWRKLCKANWCR